jgi:hypothetical protein
MVRSCPCALSIIDGPLPAFRGARRLSVQHGCAVSTDQEDGRLRLRNHAPQYVILLDGLLRQVSQEIALHGVLELAPPARRVQSGRGRKREGT